MRKRILVLLLVVLSGLAFGQYDVKNPDYNSKNVSLFSWSLAMDTMGFASGPNKGAFMVTTFGYGVAIGQSEGTDASSLPFTGNYKFGYTAKFKLTGLLSLGFDWGYNRMAFKLDQDDANKIFPDSVQHKKQKFSFHNTRIEPFVRINFDPKRGDHMGNYLDLGGYGEYALGVRHVTIDDDSVTDERVKVVRTKLNYINRFNYGLTARLGFNHVSFYGNYRLSDQFNESYTNLTLPRIVVGMQVSLWGN